MRVTPRVEGSNLVKGKDKQGGRMSRGGVTKKSGDYVVSKSRWWEETELRGKGENIGQRKKIERDGGGSVSKTKKQKQLLIPREKKC